MTDKEKEQKCASVGICFRTPTQIGDNGVLFDFNSGLAIKISKDSPKRRVKIIDLDAMLQVWDGVVDSGQCIETLRRHYVRWRFVVLDVTSGAVVFQHDYDAKNKDVVIISATTAIGDTVAWMQHMELFRQKHGCNLTVRIANCLTSVFEKTYPRITFDRSDNPPQDVYATYAIAFYPPESFRFQPVDQIYAGVHGTAAYTLGLPPDAIRPRVDISASRQINEKYVVIATHATCHAKHWNFPGGWTDVCRWIKDTYGFRIICIDKEKVDGFAGVYHDIPSEAEDLTGSVPLQERINIIKDAEFFIGLASGLSWLAWACHVPVVMISGFSHPCIEFPTPYRIVNFNECNSCWGEHQRFGWDFLTCPRLAGTKKQFICSTAITPFMVKNTIENLMKDKIQK